MNFPLIMYGKFVRPNKMVNLAGKCPVTGHYHKPWYVCLYMYTYIHMFVCTYVCMYVHMYACTYLYIHTYVYK